MYVFFYWETTKHKTIIIEQVENSPLMTTTMALNQEAVFQLLR